MPSRRKTTTSKPQPRPMADRAFADKNARLDQLSLPAAAAAAEACDSAQDLVPEIWRSSFDASADCLLSLAPAEGIRCVSDLFDVKTGQGAARRLLGRAAGVEHTTRFQTADDAEKLHLARNTLGTLLALAAYSSRQTPSES